MGDEDVATEMLLGALILGGICGVGCCCGRVCCGRWPCCCCCRRAAAPAGGGAASVKVGGRAVPVEHLRRKKDLCTAYLLWLFAGFLGAHHYYLERVLHGVLATWSFNFGLVGWAADALLLPAYTRGANRQAAGVAPSDGSMARSCCRLPCMMLLVAPALFSVLVLGPRALHTSGAVDLDRRIAKTEQNPYDALAVPRGASAAAAERAYRAHVAALELEPCGARCRAKKKELEKARAFIDGSAWRRPRGGGAPAPAASKRAGRSRRPEVSKQSQGDDAWDDWTDFVMAEWSAIKGSVVEAISDPAQPQEDL